MLGVEIGEPDLSIGQEPEALPASADEQPASPVGDAVRRSPGAATLDGEPIAGVESGDGDRGPDPEIDLEDPSLYFNRQVSWMDFNDRVLQLVEDLSLIHI